ncbi:hypothetical protein ACI2I2_14775, partial [Scandinavium sp. NPDC088450]|uniref:hypothetical protein n=1 Tax=Scandinavium sp. NPDC088450 TaxID=3364514 RepID=UPI00384C313B
TGRQTRYTTCFPGSSILATSNRQYGSDEPLTQIPIFFVISFPRWLVMKTCKIPVWPKEIEDACQPDKNDPVNKGAEHNPPQIWRPMLGLQGKERYARTFAKERKAMDRITTRLREKYGEHD